MDDNYYRQIRIVGFILDRLILRYGFATLLFTFFLDMGGGFKLGSTLA